jgi:sterol desaturase/sphingolipid hydroxylase (fatty acid hydroxylase superfamily)
MWILALVIALGVAGLAVERARPGWALPRVDGWAFRAVLANACQLLVVVVAGITWNRWLCGASLVHLEGLGAIASGTIAYVVSTLVFYFWHRARHDVPLLWRACHQLHHSPRRIEILTSFYKHPVEQVADSVLSAVIAFPLLGLTPTGAAVYTCLSALAEYVYHANLRTPRWLGLFVQRPEMHRVHHASGKHAGNYGDLPIWDMLFGTYINPPTYDGPCGFDADRERRTADMLRFVDVHSPRAS